MPFEYIFYVSGRIEYVLVARIKWLSRPACVYTKRLVRDWNVHKQYKLSLTYANKRCHQKSVKGIICTGQRLKQKCRTTICAVYVERHTIEHTHTTIRRLCGMQFFAYIFRLPHSRAIFNVHNMITHSHDCWNILRCYAFFALVCVCVCVCFILRIFCAFPWTTFHHKYSICINSCQIFEYRCVWDQFQGWLYYGQKCATRKREYFNPFSARAHFMFPISLVPLRMCVVYYMSLPIRIIVQCLQMFFMVQFTHLITYSLLLRWFFVSLLSAFSSFLPTQPLCEVTSSVF